MDYVTTMMHNAMDESAKRGKLTMEDIIYLVRKVRAPAKPSEGLYAIACSSKHLDPCGCPGGPNRLHR